METGLLRGGTCLADFSGLWGDIFYFPRELVGFLFYFIWVGFCLGSHRQWSGLTLGGVQRNHMGCLDQTRVGHVPGRLPSCCLELGPTILLQ